MENNFSRSFIASKLLSLTTYHEYTTDVSASSKGCERKMHFLLSPKNNDFLHDNFQKY